MKKIITLTSAFVLLLAISGNSAKAQSFSIQVIPAEGTMAGANLFSFWAGNASGALFNGQSSVYVGNPAVDYNAAGPTIPLNNNITTPNITSNNGQAFSSTDPMWHGFNGNGLNWGFIITSDTPFEISELSFSTTETGGDTSLETSVPAGGFQYSRYLVGWNGFQWIGQGPSWQDVYEVVGLGPTTAFTYNGSADTVANEQQGIDAYVNNLQNSASGPISVTGTVTIDGQSGSATETFDPVPEPDVVALFGSGLVAFVMAKRGRKFAVTISKRLQ
jgi:hypothetical protein